MLAVPAPTIVTVRPDTSATDVFKLSYLNVPVLLDEGSVNVKGETPKLTSEMVHGLMVGAIGETVKDEVALLLV